MCCLLLFVVLVAVAGFASVMIYDLLLMIAIVACCMVSCLLLCVYGSVLQCRVVHYMDGGVCWVGAADGMLVWGAVFSCLPYCFGAGCIDCCGFRGLSWVWWVCYLA